MAAPSLDNEFLQCWSKLTVVQKESLLHVAKNYILLKQEESIADSRANLIEAERQAYLDGRGKSFTWQQVKDMALDKDKRDAL